VAALAPERLSESTVGRPDGPVCGSNGHDGDAVVVVDHGRRHQDRAVDQRPAQPREVAALPADVPAGSSAAGVGEQLVAAAADGSRHALEQLSAERLELGHQHADHVGPVRAQAARHQARLVAEVLDDLPHVRGGRHGHSVTSVEDLGDRGDRHARVARDVGDGCSAIGTHARNHTVSITLSITIDTGAPGLQQWQLCRRLAAVTGSVAARPARAHAPVAAAVSVRPVRGHFPLCVTRRRGHT